MRPASPVVPGTEAPEVIIAENQDEYGNMPALLSEDDVVLTRWTFSPEELEFVAAHGYIYHYQWTFGQPVQPIAMKARTIHPSEVVQANPNAKPEKPAQPPANGNAWLSKEQLTELLAEYGRR